MTRCCHGEQSAIDPAAPRRDPGENGFTGRQGAPGRRQRDGDGIPREKGRRVWSTSGCLEIRRSYKCISTFAINSNWKIRFVIIEPLHKVEYFKAKGNSKIKWELF